jgi:hypothetical protein
MWPCTSPARPSWSLSTIPLQSCNWVTVQKSTYLSTYPQEREGIFSICTTFAIRQTKHEGGVHNMYQALPGVLYEVVYPCFYQTQGQPEAPDHQTFRLMLLSLGQQPWRLCHKPMSMRLLKQLLHSPFFDFLMHSFSYSQFVLTLVVLATQLSPPCTRCIMSCYCSVLHFF